MKRGKKEEENEEALFGQAKNGIMKRRRDTAVFDNHVGNIIGH